MLIDLEDIVSIPPISAVETRFQAKREARGNVPLTYVLELFLVALNMHRRRFGRIFIKKNNNDYELREEYDLSQMSIMPKGRYDPKRRLGMNVVVLAPDVAQAFPDDQAVNDVLRLVLDMMELPL